jgi:hypothetical protein
MKLLICVLICLMLVSVVYANPVEDTIRKNTNSIADDFMSKIRIGWQSFLHDLKMFFKSVLDICIEAGAVWIVGWCLSLMVESRTKKVVKVLTLMLCVKQIIIATAQYFNYITT